MLASGCSVSACLTAHTKPVSMNECDCRQPSTHISTTIPRSTPIHCIRLPYQCSYVVSHYHVSSNVASPLPASCSLRFMDTLYMTSCVDVAIAAALCDHLSIHTHCLTTSTIKHHSFHIGLSLSHLRLVCHI